MKKFKMILIVIILIVGILLVTTDNVIAENNTCTASYRSTYMNKISYTTSGNIAYYSGASGMYYTTSINPSPQYPDAEGNFSVEVPSGDQLEINFYLSEGDGKCDNNTILGSNTIFSEASSRNELYDNALCVNYRNKWSNNDTMKNAVSYCFSEITSVQYSYQEVSEWITTAEALYNETINKQPTITTDSQNVDKVNVGKLTCDYYTSGNSKTYSHIETKVNGGGENCRQTCKEVVTVEFGPPVATQAGMCFQYLVEIKSKVECEYIYTAPLPSKPGVCIPNAECITEYGISENGGPDDEFDACIKVCDNGKYTQQCIDECYKTIYDNETNSKTKIANYGLFIPYNSMLNRLDNNITKIENGTCLNPAIVDPYNDAQIQALYLQHQKDPGGSYINNQWKASSSGCSSDIAQYYFSSLAATRYTVHKVHGLTNNGMGQARYCPDPTGSGFLRLCALDGAYYQCHDVCTWKNYCASNSVISPTLAEQKYQQELAAYQTAKAACERQSKKCSTETATYTVTVDNEGKTEYMATQKQNSSSIGGTNPNIIKETSGYCMGFTNDAKNDGNTYRDVITFPGTYINNKTGQTSTNVKAEKKKFYTFIGDEFCTKLTSKSVNTAWYSWKVDKNGGELTSSEKDIINKNTKTNIQTTIDNYGYFGWSFDINCFYALIKNPNNYPPPGTPDDGDDSGPPVTSDFIFRTVDLSDLFPESDTAKNGRDPRFNWNCNGTNLNNKNYPVQPIALTKNIESVGEKIYNESNSSEYLDYEIILTPTTINRIRKDYNAKYQNYSYPKGDDETVVSVAGSQKTAGVTVYRSHFLHNFLGSSIVKKSGLIGCNNQLSATECDNRIYTDNQCYNQYMSSSVR